MASGVELLAEEVAHAEYAATLAELKALHPRFLQVYATLKLFVDGKIDDSALDMYRCREGAATLWAIVKRTSVSKWVDCLGRGKSFGAAKLGRRRAFKWGAAHLSGVLRI